MRTETHELIKELERRSDNPAARHFHDFIRASPDKDEAADEVRRLMVDTAEQAVTLVRDMGLVAHDAFYPEESKRVIDAARRMVRDIETDENRLTWRMPNDGTTVFDLKRAVDAYESNVAVEWLANKGG